jgi:single-stranded DNA-binding protein
MYGEATFSIIGNVGQIRQAGSTTKVSICANYSRKDNRGNWADDPHWNTVTVFHEPTQKFIREYVRKGDMVRVTGVMREGRYDKDGETVFTHDLISLRFSRLGPKREDSEAEPQPPAPAGDDLDDKIPF